MKAHVEWVCLLCLTCMRRCTWWASVSSLSVSMCTVFWSGLAVYRKRSDMQGHLQDTSKYPVKPVRNTASTVTSQQADFLVNSWEQDTGWTLEPLKLMWSCVWTISPFLTGSWSAVSWSDFLGQEVFWVLPPHAHCLQWPQPTVWAVVLPFSPIYFPDY